MNINLSRTLMIALNLLFVGCADNNSDSTVNLAGSYYTEMIQHKDYHEPETHYVIDDKGRFVVTYIHKITDQNGQPLIYREIYSGSYSIKGSKLYMNNIKGESVCKNNSEGNKPLDFTVNFRKEGKSLILDFGAETLTLKPLSENLLKKYANTKLCADLNITSIDVDESKPDPMEPKFKPEVAPEMTPSETGKNKKTAEDSPGTPNTEVILPPEISPVIIRPPNKNKEPDLVPYIEFENESWVEKVIKAATIECVDKKECPTFIGLLIGKRKTQNTKKTQMYQCSTTYLGDGYFSTNSHCYHRNFSSNHRSFVQNCSDEIWVKMPKTSSYKEQTLNCEKIIYLTEMVPRSLIEKNKDLHQGREAFDVMIFKVKEQVNRPQAIINFEAPVEIGEELTAWTVNPTKDQPGINGLIEKKTCHSYDHNNKHKLLTVAHPLENFLYESVHINECDKQMMKGNSGTTLFNKDSQGVAIFSHIYVDDDSQAQSNRGYGTKYTCLSEINDGDKQIFNGKNGSRCRTLSHQDIETIRENLRIREHNEVFDAVQKIQNLLTKLYNDSQKIITGQSVPDRSPLKKEIFSDSTRVSFGNPVWVSGLKEIKDSPLFKYTTTKKFDKNALGRRVENGQIVFDEYHISQSLLTVGNSINRSVNDFSIYDLQLPSCVDIRREELSRRRTDNRLNPFSRITYEYDKVRIDLPIHTYEIAYQFSPRIITDQNIDSIKVQKQFSRSSALPFQAYFEVEKSGQLSELKFEPAQNIESNELAKRIKNAVKNNCR